MGYNSQATANNSTAVGVGAIASHFNSSAFGFGAISRGPSTIVLGTTSNSYFLPGLGISVPAGETFDVRVNSDGRLSAAARPAANSAATSSNSVNTPSVAIASSAAQGAASSSMDAQPSRGEGFMATNTGSLALGTLSQSTGFTSTAVGYNSQATAASVSAFGENAKASDLQSVAIGSRSEATVSQSTAVKVEQENELAANPQAPMQAISSEGIENKTVQLLETMMAAYESKMAAYEARVLSLEAQIAAGKASAASEPITTEAAHSKSNVLETLTGAETIASLADRNGLTNAAMPRSSAAGQNSSTSGIGALALGDGATALGSGAISFGSGASASAAGAVAIGPGANASRPNQIALGTSGSTYTLAGINSASSMAVQSGALQLVTADPLGNLATSSLNIADIQRFGSSISGLEARTSELERLVITNQRQNNGGIAAAMALSGTMILPDSDWSMSFNLSTYEGEQGFSSSIVGRVTDNIYFSAAIAGSSAPRTTGGRLGISFGL